MWSTFSGAKALGSIQNTELRSRGVLLQTQPDGKPKNVLVLWCEKGETAYPTPQGTERIFDLLGRELAVKKNINLTENPIYIVLPRGSESIFKNLTAPPRMPLLTGAAIPVVIQAHWPREKVLIEESAYHYQPGTTFSLSLSLYNFDTNKHQGHLQIQGPSDWKIEYSKNISIDTQGRQQFTLHITAPARMTDQINKIRIEADLGLANKALLSMRFSQQALPKD